jgi:hypothetical protein
MINRVKSIAQRKTDKGVRYVPNIVYPPIANTSQDYYIKTTDGDRYDLLAHKFYNDSTLWWVIAVGNTGKKDSMYPPIGVQLRIPMDIKSISENYRKLNS